MAGTLLAARFVAMWGLGFATGLFAAQLSMAGTGRPEGSGAPVQAQPSASTAQAAVEAGEPARFLEMEVGDQQGTPVRPEERALRQRHQFMSGERKANHAPL